MSADLLREVKDSLDAAGKAIDNMMAVDVNPRVRKSLTLLHDCCANLARAIGVPNAVEPETGTTPHVDTKVQP